MAIIAWLVTASIQSGEVTLASTGTNEAMLVGNLFAILGSGSICVIVSLCGNEVYDYESMKDIPLIDDVPVVDDPEASDPEFLAHSRAWINKWGWIGAFVLVVLWPMATVPWGVFSEAVYSLWCSVAFMWGWAGTIVIIILPIYEVRETIYKVVSGLLGLKPLPQVTNGTSTNDVKINKDNV